jgi:hypothetical protein
MSETTSIRVGTHDVQIDGDVVHFVWNGPLNETDIAFFFDEMYRLLDKHGSAFLLMDVTHGDTVTPDARRKVMSYNQRPPFSGTVLYNASFKMKVVCNLIVNAVNLFKKDPHVVVFKKDLAEGREWVKARRGELNVPARSSLA